MLCDLVHLYNCLTRREPQWGMPLPQAQELAPPAYAAAVQTLLDTKHFVKEPAGSPCPPGVHPKKICWLLHLSLIWLR